MPKRNNDHLEYSGVVDPILKYLNSLSQCKAINIHGSVFSERGTPDITGCIRGRSFWFECKRSIREKPRSIQIRRLAEYKRAGAIAECVSSVEEVKEILKREEL